MNTPLTSRQLIRIIIVIALLVGAVLAIRSYGQSQQQLQQAECAHDRANDLPMPEGCY